MEPYERPWIRLPLEGATNVRELGGYPTASGEQTRYHRFLRSDDLSRLTAADQSFLYGYGVRAVIDLRDPSEVQDMPDCKIGPDVVHVNIPLLGFDASSVEVVTELNNEGGFSMEAIYQGILENYEGVRACFRFIAEAPEGCILFHCAVGKDRTGILSMLLLLLAGVDRWDILSDYVQSWPNLMRDEVFRADWYGSRQSWVRTALQSNANLMEFALDLLETNHGEIEDFLLECGVPDEVAAAVHDRLV